MERNKNRMTRGKNGEPQKEFHMFSVRECAAVDSGCVGCFSSLSGMTVTVDHEELTNCCSPHNFTLHLSSLSPLISFFY